VKRGKNMAFGNDLSKEFNRLTSKHFYTEEVLFAKLQDSFINLGSKYVIDIIHGRKSFVTFDYNSGYLSSIRPPQEKICELSDLLFIVWSNKKEEIRLMYMQNKRGNTYSKFRADLIQLSLLKERPLIKYPLPDCVFGCIDILTDAILKSVCSYGVFYQDGSLNIDMAYYPACHVEPVNAIGKKKDRIVKYNEIYMGKVEFHHGYRESQGEINLVKFGNKLFEMKIGTPITKKEFPICYANITEIINKTNFKDEFFENNFQYYFDNFPTTIIINPDDERDLQ